MSKLPTPGLQGDYRDTCFICFQGTDSALGFKGSADWWAAGLIILGVPENEAINYVENFAHADVDHPDVMVIRVCSQCATRAGFEAHWVDGPIKAYHEPAGVQ
jgi:hypothetical protein